MDAGFVHVLKWDSISWRKTVFLDQFRAVTCREYTLPREDSTSQPNVWIQGKHQNRTRIRSQEPESGVREKKILILGSEFLVETNIKYVVDSNYNNTEVPADLPEEQASQSSVKVIAARSKAKLKPQRERNCWITEHYTDEREKMDWYWAIRTNSRCVRSLEESDQSSSTQSNSTAGRRWSNSILENLLSSSEIIPQKWAALVWTIDGKHAWQQEEEWNGDSSIVLMIQEQVVYFRALEGHSGTQFYWPFITGQCCDSEQLLHIYLFYWMWIQSSFYHQFWIIIWRSEFKQETNSTLSCRLILGNKDHKDPEKIDVNVPRHAQYLHNAWKRHQDAENWVDINLALKKGLKFYQTRASAIILQETLPAYCVPKVVRLKNWRSLLRKSIHVTSTTTNHDWTRGNEELGSTFEQQPVGKLVQQSFGEVQTRKTLQTNPIQTPTNLWSIGETWEHARRVCCYRWNVPFPWDRWKRLSRRTVLQIDQGNLRDLSERHSC